MANSSVNDTAAAAARPSTKRRLGGTTVAEHMGKQQHRIYQAANSVLIAMKAIDTMDEDGTNRDLVALFGAFSLIEETLLDIAGEVEMEVKHG
jgi:hypothetical protein